MDDSFHSKYDADLTRQLKLISQIREHDKVRIDGGVIKIDPPGHLQPLRRFLGGDGRDRSLLVVQEVFTSTFNRVQYLRSGLATDDRPDGKEDRDNRARLVRRALDALGRARAGIKNLHITYGDDPRILSILENLSEEVDDFLDQH
jgi:hypothetical protein